MNQIPQRTILSLYCIDRNFCTSYWKTTSGTTYAFMEGQLYICSDEGEPMYQGHFAYRIQIPEQLDFDDLVSGYFPGLEIDSDPIETVKAFPHIKRFTLSGKALDGQEDVTRWFCMECSLEIPVGHDPFDGCPDCDPLDT